MKHVFSSIVRLVVRLALPCLILPAALLACARMPALRPAPSMAVPDIQEACAGVFPAGDRQFVHAVDTAMAGRRATMIGVSVVSSASRTIRSALMSLEGLVMFAAREQDGKITIDRAVPPFDGPGFARGMLDDIRMIFLRPGPEPDAVGFTAAGAPVCRYTTGPERAIDVEVDPAGGTGGWTLRRYDRGVLTRTVRADGLSRRPPAGDRIPGRMQLKAYGARGYTLDLNLIEAVPVTDARNP